MRFINRNIHTVRVEQLQGSTFVPPNGVIELDEQAGAAYGLSPIDPPMQPQVLIDTAPGVLEEVKEDKAPLIQEGKRRRKKE